MFGYPRASITRILRPMLLPAFVFTCFVVAVNQRLGLWVQVYCLWRNGRARSKHPWLSSLELQRKLTAPRVFTGCWSIIAVSRPPVGDEAAYTSSWRRSMPSRLHWVVLVFLVACSVARLYCLAATNTLLSSCAHDPGSPITGWLGGVEKVSGCRASQPERLWRESHELLCKVANIKSVAKTEINLRTKKELLTTVASLLLSQRDLHSQCRDKAGIPIPLVPLRPVTPQTCLGLGITDTVLNNRKLGDETGCDDYDFQGDKGAWRPIFFILAHHQPRLLVKLVTRMQRELVSAGLVAEGGMGRVVVLISGNNTYLSDPSVTELLRSSGACILSGPSLVYGSVDLLRAQLSLASLFMNGPSTSSLFTHYVFMSGQDYPLKPLKAWPHIMDPLGKQDCNHFYTGIDPINTEDSYRSRLDMVNIQVQGKVYPLFTRNISVFWGVGPIRKSGGPSRIIPFSVAKFAFCTPDPFRLFHLLSVIKAPEEHFWDTVMELYSRVSSHSLISPVEVPCTRFQPFVYGFYPKYSFHAGTLSSNHFRDINSSKRLIARKFKWPLSKNLLNNIDQTLGLYVTEKHQRIHINQKSATPSL